MFSFYDTDDWLYLSKTVKSIYGRKCMKCGVKSGEMHTDHIIPRSINYKLSLDIRNLQVLCKKCNINKSNTEQIDYRTTKEKEKLETVIPTLKPLESEMHSRLQKWINKNVPLLDLEDCDEIIDILTFFGFSIHEP